MTLSKDELIVLACLAVFLLGALVAGALHLRRTLKREDERRKR